MKKFKLIIILFFLLFIKQLQSKPDYRVHHFSFQTEEEKLSYEIREDYNYLMGILPSAHVFFNIVPEVSVALSFDAKTKDFSNELFTSKTRIILNKSFKQVSVFCRYSSTFIQIYLRTACFRL